MSLLEWFKKTMQTEGWIREQADGWAGRYFSEAERSVAATVARILVEQLGVRFDSFTPMTRLTEDLGMDELEPTEVVLALEEQFQFSISDDDCLRLATVADMVRYLHERVQNGGILRN